ncbi:hypothetical protein JNJ66_05565 [Candidatus Saccharibacteria bacterium]|nr:hypothetical protein [Candidatus Saccharibacteria bacterium]
MHSPGSTPFPARPVISRRAGWWLGGLLIVAGLGYLYAGTVPGAMALVCLGLLSAVCVSRPADINHQPDEPDAPPSSTELSAPHSPTSHIVAYIIGCAVLLLLGMGTLLGGALILSGVPGVDQSAIGGAAVILIAITSMAVAIRSLIR